MGESLGLFLGQWSFDLFMAVNLAAVALLYGWAVARVNRRDPAARWRAWQSLCFGLGLGLLAVVYLSPLAAWSHVFFWAHMSQHLIVMMAAAPLLVLGAPVTLWFRASGPQARRRWVVPILRSRAVRLLTDPVLTWTLFAVVLVGAHFTGFYEWALSSHDADLFVEKPLFLVVAFLYYLPLIGSNLQPRRPSHATRLLSLALMMLPEALVGAVIYFSSTVLYPTFDQERPFGPGPLDDQKLAGALMWALVMIVDSFWMMVAAAEWFASEERRSRRLDAQIAAETAAAYPPR